jgi:hypothetical protein
VDTPTYDSEGFQTWKPQPGEYYKLGLKQRESYGGIIAAVKDALASIACGSNKAYPHNFAGIIAAIEDLAKCLNAGNNIDVGDKPPDWNVIIYPDGSIDGEWNDNEPPLDGNLWFDTRQGRLFVSIDEEYWQTNGGDGLAYVSENVPIPQPVIGSTWYDTYNKIMYVWTDEGVWEAVRGAEDVAQTTATLPLAFKSRLTAGGGGGANILPDDFPTSDNFPSVLPPLDLTAQNVQADYNEWLLWSLLRVGEATEYNTINFGPNPPPEEELQPGSMWYDTNALELSVWYSDGDSNQWVPTSVSYQYDEQLARMENQIATETAERASAIQEAKTSLQSEITSVSGAVYTLENTLRQAISEAVSGVVVSDPDLSSYSTTVDLSSAREALEEKINNFKSDLELELLELQNSLGAVDTNLIASINSKATVEQLSEVLSAIPDTSNLLSEQAIDVKIAEMNHRLIPKTGGILNGRFQIQKSDISLGALDFTRATTDARNAITIKPSDNSDNIISFGTTETDGEVAFTFKGNEDFCWVYDNTDKVFSIDRSGAAVKNIVLADFGENNSNGRTLHNKIDVRDRLVKYQSAFEEMRQSISLADDFDELKLALLTALASV